MGMTQKEYATLKEMLLNLNEVAWDKGYNYSLQTSDRYDPNIFGFRRMIYIYRWKTVDSKYDTKLIVSNIMEVIEYYNNEITFLEQFGIVKIPTFKKKRGRKPNRLKLKLKKSQEQE
jgi:hypothetical protein